MANYFGTLHGVQQQQRGRHAADAAGNGRAGGDGPRRPRPPRRRAACPSGRAVTPASSTICPGCTQSGVMSPGAPAAASRMSASRQYAARSGVFRWQSVTVASARVSSSAAGSSDDETASDDGHAPARRVEAVCAQQVQARLGRAGGKARRARQQCAERCGRHAVDILAWVERVEQMLCAQRLRQRPQQQHTVHGVVRAQGAQRAGQSIRRAVWRQIDRAHGHAAPIPPSARCCADRRGHPAARPRTPPQDTAACRARLPFRAPAHRSPLRSAHRSDVLPSFSPPRAVRQTPRPRSVRSFAPRSRADARRAPPSRRDRPARADRC